MWDQEVSLLFSLCCQIALGRGCTKFAPLCRAEEGNIATAKGSRSLGRTTSQYSGCVSLLGSLLEPRELCLVAADNNLKMRNPLLFSALLHISWHKSTSFQFYSDVCQKIPAGSRYHKPFGTLAPCLTPLQMHLRGEWLA